MERLREHLGIDRWLLTGGSWGTTLALVYAERYPHRVSQIMLSAITTTRRSEIGWLYRGVARFFPQEWERFRDGAGGTGQDGDLVAAYARLMEAPDPQVRNQAASSWSTWEDVVLSLEPDATPFFPGDQPDRDVLAFVRLCAHYFSHAAWLEDNAVIRDAPRLAGIPGVLSRAHRAAAALKAGTVWVNCFFIRDLRAPFGGAGDSGIGREGGTFSREFFTEPKAVVMQV